MGNVIAAGAMSMLIYGWALIWPVSRWGLHRRGKRYRVLGWIFAVAVVLSAVAHVYVWHAYASANRDAWMAWMLPQLVGWAAWISSIIATVVLWSRDGSAS